MENTARKVRETNRESDKKFFAELRKASDEVKKRGKSQPQRLWEKPKGYEKRR